MEYVAFIILTIITIYIMMAIHIANENERFAVFALGRFVGLKGPGLVLGLPGGVHRFHRVTLGTEGEIQSNELVSIGEYAIPFVTSAAMRAGTKVRVCGFDSTHLKVEALQRFIVCEKCGHENAL